MAKTPTEIADIVTLQLRNLGVNLPNDARNILKYHVDSLIEIMLEDYGYDPLINNPGTGSRMLESWAALQFVTFGPELGSFVPMFQQAYDRTKKHWLELVIADGNVDYSEYAQKIFREAAKNNIFFRKVDKDIVEEHIRTAKSTMETNLGHYDPDFFAVDAAYEAIRAYVLWKMTPSYDVRSQNYQVEFDRLSQAWAYAAAVEKNMDFFDDEDNRRRINDFYPELPTREAGPTISVDSSSGGFILTIE